jgi:hypothetical protein
MRAFAIELERVGELVIDSLDYRACPRESAEELHGLGLCAAAFWRAYYPAGLHCDLAPPADSAALRRVKEALQKSSIMT